MRLLSMSLPEILREVDKLEKESKALRKDIVQICWYMRGSITYDEAWSLSNDDREVIGELIKENIETTKTSGLPFF
jgi:hypothetical protein